MNELYRNLVDLYAGGELSAEAEAQLEAAAQRDPELAHDLMTLKATVEGLHSLPDPDFTEESYQRILMKTYAKGIDIQTQAPDPTYLQYHLPIQG